MHNHDPSCILLVRLGSFDANDSFQCLNSVELFCGQGGGAASYMQEGSWLCTTGHVGLFCDQGGGAASYRLGLGLGLGLEAVFVFDSKSWG